MFYCVFFDLQSFRREKQFLNECFTDLPEGKKSSMRVFYRASGGGASSIRVCYRASGGKLSNRLSVRLSIRPSVCPPARPSTHPSIHPSTRPEPNLYKASLAYVSTPLEALTPHAYFGIIFVCVCAFVGFGYRKATFFSHQCFSDSSMCVILFYDVFFVNCSHIRFRVLTRFKVL